MLNFLSQEDIDLLESISNYSVEKLIQEAPINAWSTERLIFNYDLNKKGLQPLRCLLSHRINHARQDLRVKSYNSELLTRFREDGCLVLDDVFF